MNFKKILIATFSPALLLTATAVPALATPSLKVGSWSIFNNDTGAWAGGSLKSDGSATGKGKLIYQALDGSQEVATIEASNWIFADDAHTQIALCANVTGVQGPELPIGEPTFECAPLNVTGKGPAEPSPFPGELEKVRFFYQI